MRINDWVRCSLADGSWLEGRIVKIWSNGDISVRQAYIAWEDGDEIVTEYLHGGVREGYRSEQLKKIDPPESYKNWRLV